MVQEVYHTGLKDKDAAFHPLQLLICIQINTLAAWPRILTIPVNKGPE